jgi:glyoxylase I family protein
MNLEHIAFNVPDPVAMAQWYVQNFGMKIVREGGAPAHARFIADARGQMMLELYHNPAAPVLDYRAINPLALHVAFSVNDVPMERARLLNAGASAEGEVSGNDAGDQFAMLRDPWGLAVQLVKRSKPMI